MQHDIAQAIQELKKGKVIAIPTETVYGLAVNALDEQAVKKLYKIKKRPLNKPISIQLGYIEDIKKYAYIYHPREAKIIEHFMPGPLTIILNKKDILPDILTANQSDIGVRIPAHPLTLKLLQSIDFPLAVPSANISNQTPALTMKQAQDIFGNQITCYIDNPYKLSQQASTVLKVSENKIQILRQGPITLTDIENIL
jgi:L-threonylcarbamoyladenylate synthase